MNERKKIEPTDTMVEAGASYAWEEANPGILGWNSISESHKEGCRRDARAVLTAALPRLTADDLRDTPAGKQLLAEGWEAACRKVIRMAWADSSDAEYLADEGNPYRKDKEDHQ